MNAGRTIFAQLMAHAPHQEFQKCVARYDGARYLKKFSCWDQYLAMAFAQLTYRESLRDIEACLHSMRAKLYHMGFRTLAPRSTLAEANENRDWRIFADFAQTLIAIARPMHASDPLAIDLDQTLYALDSTTIDLCLSLFPWARFRSGKAAVKVHTLLGKIGAPPGILGIEISVIKIDTLATSGCGGPRLHRIFHAFRTRLPQPSAKTSAGFGVPGFELPCQV